MMKKIPVFLLFAVFIAVFAAAGLLIPSRTYSDLENRYLAQKPDFTLESFLKNEFSQEYEEYCNDQFPARDQWVTLKSVTETALGKTENNGVVLGRDGQLFNKVIRLDTETWESHTDALLQFAQKHSGNVTVTIVPNSYSVLSDKLPAGLHLLDQQSVIGSFYEELAPYAQTVDLFPALSDHAGEYIYYRTDHHWTTLGAWYGYESLCGALSLTPVPLSSFEGHEVPGFYGTYYSRSRLSGAQEDTITWYDIPVESVSCDGTQMDGLYDLSRFEIRDKYSAFLHGNHGITVIRGKNPETQKRLLILQDSFGNSIAPYFSQNYAEVTIIDLRHFAPSISQFIAENGFDDILVLYSFDGFLDERSVLRFKY